MVRKDGNDVNRGGDGLLYTGLRPLNHAISAVRCPALTLELDKSVMGCPGGRFELIKGSLAGNPAWLLRGDEVVADS